MKDKHNKNQRNWAELLKDKRFYYSLLAGGVAVLAIVFVATIAAVSKQEEPTLDEGNSSQSQLPPSQEGNNSADGNDGSLDGNQPVDAPQGMTLPVVNGTLSNDYGFFYNQTLNSYYEHEGIDFAASVGTEVFAAQDGTVEGVFTGDVLTGTEIVIDHGDGVKTVYHFVQAVEGLSAGDKVERGEVIATVAEANGAEYKDGAHLHFEILQNGKNVDPASHLDLNEK